MSDNKVYVKEGMGFEGIAMKQGKRNGKRTIAIIITAIIFFGTLGMLGQRMLQGEDKEPQPDQARILPTSVENAPTETPAPTVSVSVRPTATVRATPTVRVTPRPSARVSVTPTGSKTSKTITIAVLNGSGEKGVAGTMATTLTNAGYTVSRTGNADAFTYKGISISIKSDKKQALDQLKKDLSAANYLVTKTDTTLSASETADAVVIVGAE